MPPLLADFIHNRVCELKCEKFLTRPLTMRILLKILCAPMIAVLSVFVWLASKLVQISAVVMNFIAIAVGLGALCILFDGKTAQGICGLIAAFLFTPFGLPMFSIMLLGQVQKFRYWIQDSVYG